MVEQITLTINKPVASILVRFLANHCYEWRHCYDDQQGIRHRYFGTVPSAESREAWEELMSALESKQTPLTPITY